MGIIGTSAGGIGAITTGTAGALTGLTGAAGGIIGADILAHIFNHALENAKKIKNYYKAQFGMTIKEVNNVLMEELKKNKVKDNSLF